MHWLTGAALVAFLADQISKYLVVHVMELSRIGSIDVLPPFLNFRYGENRGINFGLLDSDADATRWILVAVALAICIFVVIWTRRTAMNLRAYTAAGLLIGGALANVVDRILYGYVLDFLNTSCCGINNPFVFNLADVFIFVGAIGLVLLAPDSENKAKKGQ